MNTSAPGRMHGSEGISAPSSSYNLLEKCVIVELFELLSSHNQIVTKSMLEESLLRYRWGIIPTRTAIDSLVSSGALSMWKNRHVGTEYIRISGHVEVAAAGWRETVKSMHADFISAPRRACQPSSLGGVSHRRGGTPYRNNGPASYLPAGSSPFPGNLPRPAPSSPWCI